MIRRLQVRHETHYVYPDAVPHAQSEARVQARNLPWQSVVREQVVLRPGADDRRERLDFFGNRVLYFSIQTPHTDSSVISEFAVDLFSARRPDPEKSTFSWRDLLVWLDRHPGTEAVREARSWTYPTRRLEPVSSITDYVREVFDAEPGWIAACRRLMTRMHADFAYAPGRTHVTTPVAECFAQRAGVCQDFAHIFLCGLRGLGFPCRYMSGYLETLPPPGKEKLVGSDATHAWVSVYDPVIGWVDLDPTNNVLPLDQHITLGWGRDFSDIIPVKGVVTGGDQQRVNVSVDVRSASDFSDPFESTQGGTKTFKIDNT